MEIRFLAFYVCLVFFLFVLRIYHIVIIVTFLYFEYAILCALGVDERNSLAGDKVTSVDFNPRKRVLATGTRGGRVVQWRCSTLAGTAQSEACWQVLPVVTASNCAVDKIKWGPGESLLHVKTERSSIILSETQLNTAVAPPLLALQIAPMQVQIYHFELQQRTVIAASFRVKGLGIGGSYVMLWNSKQVTVYEIDPRSMNAAVNSSFKHETAPIVAAALIVQGMERSIALATGTKLEFTNLTGHVQRTIQFSSDVEGSPICLDVNGGFLVASTSLSVIKVWNVSRSTPKQLGTARKFEENDETPLGEVRSVRVNSDGTRVSLLVDQRLPPAAHGGSGTLRMPDTRLFVYDLDADSFVSYSVGKNRVPVAHSWECSDARLMACEVVPQALAYTVDDSKDGASKDAKDTKQPGDETDSVHAVLTLFVAGSENILLQDSVSCADPQNNGVPRMPVALVVPYLYFARQLGDAGDQAQVNPEACAPADSTSAAITRTVLRDFAGLEHVGLCGSTP